MNLPPRLIPVVDFPVALADKLAAWNERRLLRDLYDIWFFLRMGVTVDEVRLNARLQRPVYSRLVPVSDRFPGGSVGDFYEFLRQKVTAVTDKHIEQELADILPESERVGLAMRIKAQLAPLSG